MENYKLELNEVILHEEVVAFKGCKGSVQLTLTSQKLILEKEKGIIKKEKELIGVITLTDIKIYNSKIQVNQKRSNVNIQTINKNIEISFNNMIKANKFVMKIVEACTGSSITERGTEKIKGAINAVNDVLGIDTRDVLKGVVENGITGAFVKGIKKRDSAKK